MPPKKRNRHSETSGAVKEEEEEDQQDDFDLMNPRQLRSLVNQQRRQQVDLEAELEVMKVREEKLWLERVFLRLVQDDENDEFTYLPNRKVLDIATTPLARRTAKQVLEMDCQVEAFSGFGSGEQSNGQEGGGGAPNIFYKAVETCSELVRLYEEGLEVGAYFYPTLQGARETDPEFLFIAIILSNNLYTDEVTQENQQMYFPVTARVERCRFNVKLARHLQPTPYLTAGGTDPFIDAGCSSLQADGVSYPADIQQRIHTARYDTILKKVWVPDAEYSGHGVKRAVRVDIDLNRMLEVRADGFHRELGFGEVSNESDSDQEDDE